MRHLMSGRRLNRTSSHRKATFRNLSISLLGYGAIKTTLPKAKELRKFIEPVITLAKRELHLRRQYESNSLNMTDFKTKTVALRRRAFQLLRSKTVVRKLFEDIAPQYETRPGGYTRVLKQGHRFGDSAPMAFIELIDISRSHVSKNGSDK